MFAALPIFRPSAARSVVRLAGLPSLVPRAFAAARACLVRVEMASRSCSAMIAMMPTVMRLASGMLAATKSTPASRRLSKNAASRDSRSILAISRVARCKRHAARAREFSTIITLAAFNLGELGNQFPSARHRGSRGQPSRWASRPRPLRPWRSVETRVQYLPIDNPSRYPTQTRAPAPRVRPRGQETGRWPYRVDHFTKWARPSVPDCSLGLPLWHGTRRRPRSSPIGNGAHTDRSLLASGFECGAGLSGRFVTGSE